MTELQNALTCAGRVFALLDEAEQTPDAPGALDLAPEEVTGAVELRDVDFRYAADRPLIEDLNLSVRPGQHVAIVGPTGCGKTTLINLLMRFYDVDGGAISVSGREIRTLRRRALRRSYGMVLQDTWLKSGTIRENIAYGKPDATEEEIVSAASAPTPTALLCACRRDMTRVISEDGGGLSQGQKQLLCIARVMLYLPPMLILDEGYQLHRHPHGAEDPGRLRPDDGRAHQLYRGPPPVHHPLGGRDPGDAGRSYRGAGQPRVPDGPGRLLRPAVQQPV